MFIDSLIKQAEEQVIKTLEENMKGKMRISGDSRVIPNINDETGALLVLADLCEWTGAGKSGFPPYVESKNKKVGLNVHSIKEGNQICSMVLIEDFFNSMM